MSKRAVVLGLVLVLVFLTALYFLQRPKKIVVKEAAKPAAPLQEDCVSFNPETTKATLVRGRWKVVDGDHYMFDFGENRAGAAQTVQIIQHYRMNRSCFVGRPDPRFKYMLIDQFGPTGALNGEDCLAFNLAGASVENVSGRWMVVDGRHWIFDFGPNKDEAETSLAIIKKYGFNQSCYVARPKAPFSYMRN